MSITVKNITKTYGSQYAVKDVSFAVPKSETCGFLGPNGAGKSTTLKIITGFLQADEGNVEIEGIDVQKHPIDAKRKIGYLAEHNPLYKDMYVREFLNFIAESHHLSNKRSHIDSVIEQTGLQKEAHKLVGQLSKGYQQRVGLAQALIHDPEVLILDEPLSGLDPNQLHELRELVRKLGKEKTVIFSSHILQEVEQVANRVLMIKNGEIVLDQLQSEMFEETSFVIAEFSEDLSETELKLLAQLGDFEQKENLYHLIGSGSDFRKQLFDFAVQNQLTLLRLEERKEDLTNIFQKTTSN